jgi:hypothetical protein
VATANRLGSEWRRRLIEAFAAVFFFLAPSSAPAWRLDPDQRLFWVLDIGEISDNPRIGWPAYTSGAIDA